VAQNSTDTAARIASSIASLPPLPTTAQAILTCFGDEFIDADKVAAVVEGDPGICAKLLGLSNSAYFGLAEPVHTIGEAISRVLGVDTVRSLVLAMAIQRSFDSGRCPAFRTERFWTQSLLTAECCKKIAALDAAADDAVRDLAYSTGLCHNLGLLALVHIEPERTQKVLSSHRDSEEPIGIAELFSADLNTDQRIVTAEVARNWSLPEGMVSAYQYRAFPHTDSDHRLGLVLSAGVAAVENAPLDPEDRIDISELSGALDIDTDDLQGLAELSGKQKERVDSLASNMSH